MQLICLLSVTLILKICTGLFVSCTWRGLDKFRVTCRSLISLDNSNKKSCCIKQMDTQFLIDRNRNIGLLEPYTNITDARHLNSTTTF